jgi:hypothetical protein
MNALSVAWRLRVEMSALLSATSPGQSEWAGELPSPDLERGRLHRGNSEIVGLCPGSGASEAAVGGAPRGASWDDLGSDRY